MPNYAIYARVSTKKQSTDPQVDELREIAEKKGWTVTQTVMEKVSGIMPKVLDNAIPSTTGVSIPFSK